MKTEKEIEQELNDEKPSVTPTGFTVEGMDLAYHSKEKLIEVIKAQDVQLRKFLETREIQLEGFADLFKKLK